MILPAAWLQQSRVAAHKGRAAELFLCSRCAASLRASYATIRRGYIKESRNGALHSIRTFHSSQKAHFPSPGVLLDEKSSKLFQAELNRKVDIHTYLKNWKPASPELNIDPIFIPDSDGKQSPWVGNMLRDEPLLGGELGKESNIDLIQSFAEESDHFPYLWPGDLVLLEMETGFSSGQIAIYIRTINDQQQFYTERGKWRIAHPNEMSFALKARASQDMIAPLLPYLPKSAVEKSWLPQVGLEGGVPRPICKPLLEWMAAFRDSAQEFSSQNWNLVGNIYGQLADKEDFQVMTLDEIGKRLLGRESGSLTEVERFAIHNCIKKESFYIVPNKTHSTTESYTFRPRQQADVIQCVVKWARQYQNFQAKKSLSLGTGSDAKYPIAQFARKARKLIFQSRKTRQPTPSFSLSPTVRDSAEDGSSDGMAYKTFPVESFTDNDQMIIKFLKLWVTPPSLMTSSVLKTAGSLIIRSIEMYDDYPLNPQTGYLVLQEIGAVAPWENMHVLNELVALPGHGVSPVSDQIFKESNEFCETMTPDSLIDSMKDLRKDWGDIPVFCVDSPGAAEIDDGFSIEPVEGSEDEYWIHVHVANPSSFIPPDHILAKGAEHLKRSFYSPERIYPMLPPSVTQEFFSLGPKKPALTFSAKLNRQGDILERQIINGVVNNVIYITPGTLRKLYGIDHDKEPRLKLSVGGEVEGPSRPELQKNIPEEHKQSLRMMQELLNARWEVRQRKGAMDSSSMQRSQPYVSGGRGNAIVAPSVNQCNQSLRYIGDPSISISGKMIDPLELTDSTKQDLVSHAMLLGGEVAAQWCKERKIPLFFNGATQRPEDTVLHGMLGTDAMSSENPRPKGYLSSEPVPHVALGMDEYTKCTSPLRRYSDLLCHWQIEAALRHEAESKELMSEQENPVLPFSTQAINALIAQSAWQNHVKDRAQSMSRDFWTMHLLFRGFNYGQAELPETFRCLIVNHLLEGSAGKVKDAKAQYIGSLLPFRLRCCISMDREMPPLKPGDVVDVKIQQTNLYNVFLDVDFVKLVKRLPEGAEGASRGFFV